MYIKNINRYAKIFIVPRIVSSFKIRIIIIMINISVINIKKKISRTKQFEKNLTFCYLRFQHYLFNLSNNHFRLPSSCLLPIPLLVKSSIPFKFLIDDNNLSEILISQKTFYRNANRFVFRLIDGAKEKAKQTKRSQRIEINSSQDSPSLARGTQEGRSRFVPKLKERARFPSSTPPGSETSSSPRLHFTTLSLTLSPFRQPILLASRKTIHTRAQGRAYFRFREMRNAYDEVRRDAACRLKPSFSLLDPRNHGAEGVGCVCRSPPRRPSPTPVPAVYPYWRELEATWCAIVDRSTLAPLSKGANTFERGIVVEDIFCGCLESCYRCSFFLFSFWNNFRY